MDSENNQSSSALMSQFASMGSVTPFDGIDISVTKLLFQRPSENKIKSVSISALFLCAIFWPLIKLSKFPTDATIFCISICSCVLIPGFLCNDLPYSVILYFYVIYIGIVWSDLEALIASNREIFFLDVIRECREKNGWHLFGKEKNSLKILLLENILVLLYLGGAVTISWYFSQSLLTTYEIMYRVCLYTVLFFVVKEIRNAFLIKLNRIDSEKETIDEFLESFDSKAAYVASQRINMSLEYWHFFEQILFPIEVTQTAAYIFSLFLIVTCFIFQVDAVINFFRLGQDYINEWTVIKIWINFAAGTLVVAIKLHLSYMINKKYRETSNEFLVHKNALLFIESMPELFIQIDMKYDRFSSKIPLSAVTINETVRHNYMIIKLAVSKIIWGTYLRDIQANKDSITNLKSVKENLIIYSSIMLNRLELVLEEYKKLFSSIEYKFLGVFTVNGRLLINLSVALAAPVSTYLLHIIYQ